MLVFDDFYADDTTTMSTNAYASTPAATYARTRPRPNSDSK